MIVNNKFFSLRVHCCWCSHIGRHRHHCVWYWCAFYTMIVALAFIFIYLYAVIALYSSKHCVVSTISNRIASYRNANVSSLTIFVYFIFWFQPIVRSYILLLSYMSRRQKTQNEYLMQNKSD